jgi:hypothetical protein
MWVGRYRGAVCSWSVPIGGNPQARVCVCLSVAALMALWGVDNPSRCAFLVSGSRDRTLPPIVVIELKAREGGRCRGCASAVSDLLDGRRQELPRLQTAMLRKIFLLVVRTAPVGRWVVYQLTSLSFSVRRSW